MLIKQIIKLSDLKRFAEDDSSCIELKTKCTKRLHLLPGQFNDIKKSVKENLHSIKSTYDSELNGIILNFKNVKIIPLVSLTEDINVDVNYVSDVYIFRPQVGKVLKGTINKKSQDHIGCLVHKYFNATISRPNEVSFDSWKGKDLNIGDEIMFKVINVDLDRRLPYIRGCLLESDTEVKSAGSVLNEINPSTVQALTPSTSSNFHSFKLTPCENITKALNPNFSSSDEEGSVRKKKSSLKRSSTSLESCRKEKLPFRNTQLPIHEDVDSPVSRKQRKL